MPSPPKKIVKIIWPASITSDFAAFRKSVQELNGLGFEVRVQDPIPKMIWPFATSSIADRCKELNETLLDPSVDIVLCGRGGYGVSDLLPHLSWRALRSVKPKLVVGFSDITALQAALLAKLRWPSLHGPMIQSDLWPSGASLLTKQIVPYLKGRRMKFTHHLTALKKGDRSLKVSGTLFGGCVSVLTNLIGTPYLPSLSKEPHLLFWEDVQETAPKLIRYFNQWQQSGRLKGVKALILGRFTQITPTKDDDQNQVEFERLFKNEVAERCDFPVFSCQSFGHIKDNLPLINGGKVILKNEKLESF